MSIKNKRIYTHLQTKHKTSGMMEILSLPIFEGDIDSLLDCIYKWGKQIVWLRGYNNIITFRLEHKNLWYDCFDTSVEGKS